MTDQTTDVAERTEGSVAVPADDHAPMLPGELRPHPSPRQYVMIAVVLVVVTAFEIAASYLEGDIDSNLLILVLLVMAAVKFFLVAAWYMHLKTDRALFRGFFLTGATAAFFLYLIVLLTFQIFSSR